MLNKGAVSSDCSELTALLIRPLQISIEYSAASGPYTARPYSFSVCDRSLAPKPVYRWMLCILRAVSTHTQP